MFIASTDYLKKYSIGIIYLKRIISLVALYAGLATASANAQTTARLVVDSIPPTYVPNRVWDTKHKRFIAFESMLADVLFLGEQRDDPATHRLEAATLEGLARRRGSVVLAMEMFERDVQPSLDDYLAGRSTEGDFLARSRPWPRYRADYRPLVEFARAWKGPGVAGDG